MPTPGGHSLQLIISFSFFIGKPFTVFEAGLALNTHGSFVNGFTPLRAGVAGFTFNLRLMKVPNLNLPPFFSCCAAKVTTPSIAPLTSFGFEPIVSATELYAPETVIAEPVFLAGLAFIAFFAPFIAAGAFFAAVAFIGNIFAVTDEVDPR